MNEIICGFHLKLIIITRLSCTASLLHSTVLPSSNEADCRWSALEKSKVAAICPHFCTNTIHLRILKNIPLMLVLMVVAFAYRPLTWYTAL